MNAKRSRPTWIIALLAWVAVIGLAGCTWTDTISLPDEYGVHEVYGAHTSGQEFTCHHAGLKAIDILLRATASESTVTLHLKDNLESAQDITAVTIQISPRAEPAFERFDLPLQDDINGKSFFLLIEAPELGEAQAVLVPYYAGANRTLVLDGAPIDGHLSFQLHYDNFSIVKDLVRQAATLGGKMLWLLFLSALLYLLPGGAMVVWLLREGDWIERTILAMGLSVALLALLMYATMTGLRLNSAIVIGFLALCGAAIAARWIIDWRKGTFKVPSWRDTVSSLRRDPAPAVLAFVFALVLGVRLWVVRDLVAPMWGDSYQHTMISQLMIENGGLFDSWEPYAPLTTFTYHFGFHANVAIYRWLSGDDMLHSVIWIGQIMNALAVFVLYPLAVKVSGGNRWAGVGAVLVAGLLSPMPMYYVNWGRYTQLAGQVILPVAMWLTWELGEKVKWDWKWATLLVISLTGLGITHYRVVLMYGAFVIAWGVFFIWNKWKRWGEMGRAALLLAAVGGITLLLFLPWGVHTFAATIPRVGQFYIKQGNQDAFTRQQYNDISSSLENVTWSLWILGLCGLGWQSIKHKLDGWCIGLWIGILLLLANPYVLSIPGTGIVNNFAVFIMLYIPLSILGGLVIDGLIEHLKPNKHRYGRLVLTTLIALTAIWSVAKRSQDIDLGYALLTESDIQAMDWIVKHTSSDAEFLVNGFMAYGGTSVVGADGGWWIPLVTKRQNTVPPLNYGTEMAEPGDYYLQVNEQLIAIQEHGATSVQGLELLQKMGITHVYIGQGNGQIGNADTPLLDSVTLAASPAYHQIYKQNTVSIFELVFSKNCP